MRKSLFKSQVDFERKADPKLLAESVRNAVESLDVLSCRVLKFVLQHMKRMSDIKGYRIETSCVFQYILKFEFITIKF